MEGYGPPVTGNIFFGNSPAGSSLPFIDGGWGKRDGQFETRSSSLSYLDLCRVVLSHSTPNALFPRFRKTSSTRECGVQVNAKLDKTVQCSLGAKTLYSHDDDVRYLSTTSPVFATPGGKAPFNTPVNNVRFSRPLSIYSPAFDRRSFLKSRASCSEDGGSEAPQSGALELVGSETKTIDAEEGDTSAVFSESLHQEFKGPHLQFLEKRYGHFHCRNCHIRWESAYVWCVSGTSKVYYKQLCRKCRTGLNPYRVESILCQVCQQTLCCCENKQRHINMKRPHRQDLCCRCKGMRLSCDSTYSFKYIV
ncbi:hypothetical protein NHX12_010080 [Muraenolepis orangiensis]|uniref:3CxxC-type domain-containing protein n=1 Tax=Muraenolepis orangiensis TaxID=630683 RepID=A0A9Q0DHJ7_9TELE|nr:hypothetical protein NHX12_010080 [Muraenolepis orangiensis]